MELTDFIIQAKQASYAAGNESLKIKFDDGSQGFEFARGEYLYQDRYEGFDPFFGRERVVEKNEKPVWVMNYYGKILAGEQDPGQIYSFLRDAMQRISPEYPFRGPARLQKADLMYENWQEGDMGRFQGTETIFRNGKAVYVLHYHGGRL